jgi:hypothetical protein
MSEHKIPDFDPIELSTVQERLIRRYGKEVEVQQAEVEVRIDPADVDLSWCPALFWSERGASFVVLKLGERRYRPLFYYQPDQQFGTGHDSYPDLGDCITTVLRVQTDHMAEMAGIASGNTGKDLR